MKPISNTRVRSLGRALIAIVFICGSHAVLRGEGATYHKYIWSGGQTGFAGVLFLDCAYCRYDSSEGLCDLIGPGSYVTTPGGGRYDLWQLQRDRKLRVRATFSSTQLRQLYIAQTGSLPNGLPGGLTLTQNYTNEALVPTAISDGHDNPRSSGRLQVKDLDSSGSWIPAAGVHALRDADGIDNTALHALRELGQPSDGLVPLALSPSAWSASGLPSKLPHSTSMAISPAHLSRMAHHYAFIAQKNRWGQTVEKILLKHPN